MEVLLWRLKNSEKMEQYQKYDERTGCAPDEVLNAPKLETVSVGEEFLFPQPMQKLAWDGFNAISGSRPVTAGGVGGIPFAEKREWLDEQGVLDPDDRAAWMAMIEEMDGAFRKHVAGKNPKKEKGKDGTP